MLTMTITASASTASALSLDEVHVSRPMSRHGVRLEPGCDDGLCPKCDPGGDPPELQTNAMVSYFLALTAGPSLTSLVFSLSVEYFVEVGLSVGSWRASICSSG